MSERVQVQSKPVTLPLSPDFFDEVDNQNDIEARYAFPPHAELLWAARICNPATIHDLDQRVLNAAEEILTAELRCRESYQYTGFAEERLTELESGLALLEEQIRHLNMNDYQLTEEQKKELSNKLIQRETFERLLDLDSSINLIIAALAQKNKSGFFQEPATDEQILGNPENFGVADNDIKFDGDLLTDINFDNPQTD